MFALKEALSDWHWLEHELLPTLTEFESPQEVTDFVLVKVDSLVAMERARMDAASVDDAESLPYKNASEKFHRLFSVGSEDKLVGVAGKRCVHISNNLAIS